MEKDGLKVENFKSSVRMTSMNKETPKKIAKKGYVIGILITAAIAYPIINSAIYSHGHDQVEHAGDTYDEGILKHNHELTKEDFIRDYKFKNPEASEADVIEAIDNGELRDYMDGNKGYITIENDLQNNEIETNVSYYNNDCVDFADEYLANQPSIKK